MADSTTQTPSPTESQKLAARSDLLTIWDPATPMPSADWMPDLPVVTHVDLEKAQPDGYHYLHESAIAFHRGALHVIWANHREAEYNVTDELIRGVTSTDGGMTWTKARTLIERPQWGARSFNHPVIATHQGKLWGFITRWDDQSDPVKNEYKWCCSEPGVGPQPTTEIVQFNDATSTWESVNARVPGFLPFHPPMKMRDGNWIIGGEILWFQAAVLISKGDDWTKWDLVPIPLAEGTSLFFPETALIDQGDRIIALCRPNKKRFNEIMTSPASVSTDCGRTWTTMVPSNFPLCEAQPFAGKLSTGQHYFISCHLEDGRTLITIAVTKAGEKTFKKIWKIRHCAYPRRRLFPGFFGDGKVSGEMKGSATEWSYPAAIEHDGKLFISYTQGKEDCVLSFIPITALAV